MVLAYYHPNPLTGLTHNFSKHTKYAKYFIEEEEVALTVPHELLNQSVSVCADTLIFAAVLYNFPYICEFLL